MRSDGFCTVCAWKKDLGTTRSDSHLPSEEMRIRDLLILFSPSSASWMRARPVGVYFVDSVVGRSFEKMMY